MAQVTITGTIKAIGKTQEVSPTFRKRELVITEPSGQRPQHIPIEFTQDRAAMLDPFKPGDEVSVNCFVNGREWAAKDGTMKYFLSLAGTRIEQVGAATEAPSAGAPAPARQQAPPPPIAPPPGDEDDLPF